ncbi:MAG: hypothetical protein KR126chlam4_00438 [Candidatus Anoxychlamydiales bacterium]|nr:hypothetical protein [Candidatus Anoxychlamydiales bacterium]HEU64712.1 hypothetical protein [Chlamydiota bacterium]
MTTKEIYWGLGDKGVGFYKIMQAQNKVMLEEGNLMITLGQLMKGINDAISADSLDLKKTTDNLNMLNFLDLAATKIGVMFLLSTFGLGALSSMALEPEEAEASTLQKALSGSSKIPYFLVGKSSAKIWLRGIEGAMGAGIIISCLQAYFSANTGIDNSQIQNLKAYSDGEQEDVKLVNNSENRASQTIQSIAKSDQQAIQNDYNSKTQQMYYNNN